ncbi:MAG: DNA recombination protein RmuC [Prevotellaceae bacterium]|jgi:DNA recombination protein RmuC|nr:DNA recombination protein RmuC [Prevotellaceae bacterium]
MDIAFLIIGLLVGATAAWLISKSRYSANQGISQAELEERYVARAFFDDAKRETEQYGKRLLAMSTELAKSEERVTNLEKDLSGIQETFRLEFKNLANELLEEKSKKFTELNEKKIGDILFPLKEKIRLFEKKVEDTYNQETREKASLRKELEQMMKLNTQVSEDANKLTKALKGDSKTQGDWGEIQLELTLEKAGLQKGIHFLLQENYKTEDNANVRPDCVINLPEGKNLVIDSKVSLTAYEHYYNEEDEAKRDRYLTEHISSLNRHIQDLGGKNYHNLYGINAPDYVLLFVPLEAALTLALKEDTSLLDKAWSRNIGLVSTSTLLATLRTVSSIWKRENQRKNVLEIAKEGGALYDKFVGFMEDLTKVGLRLDDAKKEYVEAMKKLFESPRKGDTIIGRTQRLKDLGAKATKTIQQQLLDRIEE